MIWNEPFSDRTMMRYILVNKKIRAKGKWEKSHLFRSISIIAIQSYSVGLSIIVNCQSKFVPKQNQIVVSINELRWVFAYIFICILIRHATCDKHVSFYLNLDHDLYTL